MTTDTPIFWSPLNMGRFSVSQPPADQEKEKERALKGEADYLEPWRSGAMEGTKNGEILSINEGFHSHGGTPSCHPF